MILPILVLLASTFSSPTPLSADVEGALSQNPQTMSEYVRQYFADTPILADIAWCESRNRQWDKDGNVFRGAVNHSDVGIMQVNVLYHEDEAEKLGVNLYSLSGNLEYAQYLYEKQGTAPWKSSEPCWSKLASK